MVVLALGGGGGGALGGDSDGGGISNKLHFQEVNKNYLDSAH